MTRSARAKATENFIAAVIATIVEEFVTIQCAPCNANQPHSPEYIAVILFFFVGFITVVRWIIEKSRRDDHPPVEPGRAESDV